MQKGFDDRHQFCLGTDIAHVMRIGGMMNAFRLSQLSLFLIAALAPLLGGCAADRTAKYTTSSSLASNDPARQPLSVTADCNRAIKTGATGFRFSIMPYPGFADYMVGALSGVPAQIFEDANFSIQLFKWKPLGTSDIEEPEQVTFRIQYRRPTGQTVSSSYRGTVDKTALEMLRGTTTNVTLAQVLANSRLIIQGFEGLSDKGLLVGFYEGTVAKSQANLLLPPFEANYVLYKEGKPQVLNELHPFRTLPEDKLKQATSEICNEIPLQ